MAADFQRAPPGPDVLVVIFETVGQIVAKAAARQPRARCADAHQIGKRHARGNHRLGLVIAAIGDPRLERRVLRQRLGHIFDRAADRVAAIERALRAAQHLDALDIIDIEHGGLWPVEIDIVEIDADALLETGNRVLLADAADEGREGRVGPARWFQCGVGRGLADIGNVDRALLLQLFCRERGDGDRNIDLPFFAEAGGDDDKAFIRALIRRFAGLGMEAGGRDKAARKSGDNRCIADGVLEFHDSILLEYVPGISGSSRALY